MFWKKKYEPEDDTPDHPILQIVDDEWNTLEHQSKEGLHRALEQLRKYYEREDYAIPESISVELAFCTVYIHNPQIDIAPVMSYFAIWVDKFQWERESVKQFLTNWLRGPVPAGISISFNHTTGEGVGLAAEYSGSTLLLSIEYILNDLEL